LIRINECSTHAAHDLLRLQIKNGRFIEIRSPKGSRSQRGIVDVAESSQAAILLVDQFAGPSGVFSSHALLRRNVMSLLRREFLSASAAAATLTASGTSFAQKATPTVPDAQDTAQTGMAGSLPTNEKKLRIITLRDLEADAQKVMAPFGFAYVAGAAGDEWTMRENLAAFNRWVIMPDYLSGHRSADTSTTILGSRIPSPVIAAPIGNQAAVHAQKEAPPSRERRWPAPSMSRVRSRR
jgi:hypothetical protein